MSSKRDLVHLREMLDIVWDIVTADWPVLIAELEKIVPPEDEEAG